MKNEVEIFWKGLNKNSFIGKFYISNKLLNKILDINSFSIDIIDEINTKKNNSLNDILKSASNTEYGKLIYKRK